MKLDNPRRVVALAMVENNAPIRKDTLGWTRIQGLTGDRGDLAQGRRGSASGSLDEDGVPVLTADPNALQDVTEAIRGTLQNVNRIVADNQSPVKNSLRNLETFTAALARNSEKIDNVMLKVDGVMGKADNLVAAHQHHRRRQCQGRIKPDGEIDPRTGRRFRRSAPVR